MSKSFLGRAALSAAVVSLAMAAEPGAAGRVAAATSATRPDGGPGPAAYVEPDLRAWVFDPQAMRAPADLRARIAEVLAAHVANDLSFDAAGDREAAARALGVALRVAPESRPAVMANLALRRGRRPGGTPPAGWGPKSFVEGLSQAATTCGRAGSPADRVVAAHLWDLILSAAPDNEDAQFEAEVLRQAGVRTDWSWADPNRQGAVTAAAAAGAAVADRPPAGEGGPAVAARPVAAAVGREICRVAAHGSPVTQVLVLPDGRRALSAGGRTAKLWELTTGREVRTFDVGGDLVWQAALTADGRRLTLLCGRSIQVWAVDTGERVSEAALTPAATLMAVSPDGTAALVGSFADPAGPRVIDPATGAARGGAPPHADAPCYAVALSPDGRRAAASPGGRTVVLWSPAEPGSARPIGGFDRNVWGLAFSPDSALLAAADDVGGLNVWDVAAGLMTGVHRPGRTVGKLAFSPDGRHLVGAVSGPYPSRKVGVMVWRAGTGAAVHEYELVDQATAVAVSPDGRFVLAGTTAGAVHVWQSPPAMTEADPAAATITGGGNAGTGGADRIERPEFADRVKPAARRQTSVRGLVVRDAGDGAQYGFATEFYLTLIPSENPHQSFAAGGQVQTARPVGPAMQAVLREAERAVRLRYPKWEQGPAQFSFADKSSPIDGESAGAAFAVLMLSALEGFAVDPAAAVTGDVTVDWRVRRVGAVAAKIRGATVDGCARVVVPKENDPQLDDLLTARGGDPFWGVQVLSAEAVHDAVRLLRSDRAAPLAEALSAFAALQVEHRRDPAAFRSPAGVAALERVVKLAPEHASARQLLRLAKKTAPARLSATATLYEAFAALAEFRSAIRGGPVPDGGAVPDGGDGAVGRSRATLARLVEVRRIAHPDAAPLVDALSDFVKAYAAAAAVRTPGGDPVARAAVEAARRRVDQLLNDLRTNHDLMERMLREGI